MSDYAVLISQSLRAGHLAEAAGHLRRALAAEPGNPDHATIAAEVFRRTGELEEALGAADRAVALAPDSPAAWNNRGLVLLDLERPAEAEGQFRRALAVQPAYARGHFNLAQSLIAHDRPREAIPALEEALRLEPDRPRTLAALGHARRLSGDLGLGLEFLRAAYRRLPGHPPTLVNLAGALLESGDRAGAERLLRRTVEIDPAHAAGWHDLGSLLEGDERLTEAADCYRRALAGRSRNGPALASLVNAKRRLCDWSDWEGETSRLLALVRNALDRDLPCPIWPAASLRLPFTAAEQLAVARRHADHLARRAGGTRLCREEPPLAPGDRLRVGFLSREFCHSVAGHLAQGLFGRFDRTRFEIWAFDYSADDGSAVRRRILGDCDRVVSVSRLSDLGAARAIAEAGTHLLVEITSYLPHGRPGILALRPAPVQVSYLYPATLGADFVDSLLTDSVASPPGDDAFFAETLVRLPHCYLPANREQAIAETDPGRAHWGLPPDGFVFAAFNAPDKIDPTTFDTWMRILTAVPGSVLWQRDGATAAVRENLRREARRRGVDPGRIVFASTVASVESHLARHRHAGLLLDTFIHGAHATAMDALWAGVPVLTCLGTTLASRVAASALTAIGLNHLIAADPADYERRAIALAEDPSGLSDIRAQLGARRMQSPLFDTDRLARDLEHAFLGMWERRGS